MDRLTRIGRRWLFLIHRWLGIVTCVLCAAWFVSGVVMMYVPYPALTAKERIAGQQRIDWSQVRLSPQDALGPAVGAGFPKDLRLEMREGRPVYRLTEADGGRSVISAVDGLRLGGVDAAAAQQIAREFAHDPAARWSRTIQRDQWTVAQRYNKDRPLHVVRLSDAAGTELYVSSTQGAVVADTHRSERFWNWVGSVPHWLYFTVVRQDADLWRQVVMWASGPAIVGAALGIWVGILRVRVRRRYPGGRVTPYRGWMKWHHVAGLIGGLFVVTWLFSGWLSVNPFKWFARDGLGAEAAARYAGATGRRHFTEVPAGLKGSEDAREVRFVWVAGRPLALAETPVGQQLWDAGGRPFRFTDAALVQAARRMLPDTRLEFARRLTAQDAYWYSHHNDRPLPVVRVAFADPAATWIHIDAKTGLVAGETNRSGRTYRWLFNALHSLDFKLLIQARPAWDVVVWLLALAGLIVSVTGVVIGWRRLKHDLRGLRAPAADEAIDARREAA